MEKLLCIDFGSSYTKVAVRTNWNEPTELLRELSHDEEFSFCIPSTVACIKREGRFTWLIGEDALSQPPGANVRLYQNWKGKLLSELGTDSDYESVATQFFQRLLRQLADVNPQLSNLPIRICIPRLENESAVQEQMLDILKIAGIKVAANKPCLFEPEANIYGVTTRGRNVAWHPKGSQALEPHYGGMFERDRGGLFDELRTSSRKLDDFQYTIMVVDIGSFTVDFGCVRFSVLGGEIDDFRTPDVVQESQPIGISQLDVAVMDVLRSEVAQAIKARPYRDWEDIKKRIYNGHEAAVRSPKRGVLIVGQDGEAENIASQIDDYSARLVRACVAFCKRHEVSPKRTVLTGGGALISGLRKRVVSGLKRALKTSMYDLLDEREPYQVLLEKRTPQGWRYDEKEVDARLRVNRDLVRGGSAIGGCSVFVDLPNDVASSRARKTRV